MTEAEKKKREVEYIFPKSVGGERRSDKGGPGQIKIHTRTAASST